METRIGQSIEEATRLLDQGALIGMPTETVYGLGGNAFNEEAVTQIFEVKNRPSFDPLILHLDQLKNAKDFVEHIPKPLQVLADNLTPGPITFILPKLSTVPDLVTSGQPTVALRIPDHSLTLQLLEQLNFPVAAPSANPFGYVSPTTPEHVYDQLNGKIPYILNGGPCEVGLESTIVKAEGKGVRVLRLGGTPVEAIRQYVKSVSIDRISASNPESPGQLKSHYSPGVRVKIGDPRDFLKKFKPAEIGIISFQQWYKGLPDKNQFILSPKGNLKEAAKNLFKALRQLDKANLKIIVAEQFPDEGLGMAINDRLKRAANP